MALKAMEEEAALTQRLERRLDGIPDGWLTAAANAAAVRAGNQPQLPTPTPNPHSHKHTQTQPSVTGRYTPSVRPATIPCRRTVDAAAALPYGRHGPTDGGRLACLVGMAEPVRIVGRTQALRQAPPVRRPPSGACPCKRVRLTAIRPRCSILCRSGSAKACAFCLWQSQPTPVGRSVRMTPTISKMHAHVKEEG